jgi:group I intron endonuclease
MKILYIYRITNLLNGKKYIGKHSSMCLDNNYYGSGVAIAKAIKKYGKSNFKKDVICICENENHLNEMEIYYINKENTFKIGYNMTKGGEGMLGYKPTQETKEKASISRKKYYKENPQLLKKLSDLAKKKIGDKNPFFGKKLTKEHIEKLRKARVKAITGGNNPSARKLLCIEKNIIFQTAKDAAIFCGLKHSTSILKAAKGLNGLKSAGGYTWKLID